jgi:hypothetical protein
MKMLGLQLRTRELLTLFTVLSLALAMLSLSSCSRVTRAEREKITEMTRNFDGSEEARQRISDAYDATNIHIRAKVGARLCVRAAKSVDEMTECLVSLSYGEP